MNLFFAIKKCMVDFVTVPKKFVCRFILASEGRSCKLFFLKKHLTFKKKYYILGFSAEIAQLVEHFTRNEGVEGSSPFFSLKRKVPEMSCFWNFFI